MQSGRPLGRVVLGPSGPRGIAMGFTVYSKLTVVEAVPTGATSIMVAIARAAVTASIFFINLNETVASVLTLLVRGTASYLWKDNGFHCAKQECPPKKHEDS